MLSYPVSNEEGNYTMAGKSLKKVTCQGCGAELTYDPSKIPQGKVKGTCKKCGNKILINNNNNKVARKTPSLGPTAATRKCPNCNSKLEAGTIKCGECGVDIQLYLKKQWLREKKHRELRGDNTISTKQTIGRPESSDTDISYKNVAIVMGSIVTGVIIGLYLMFGGSNKSYNEVRWYSGGNLHRETLHEWQTATFSNKLATAADMAISIGSIEKQVRDSGDMDTIRPYANDLVACIDEMSKGKQSQNVKVSEAAASCLVLMKGSL